MEKEFPKGIIFKLPKEGAPDFIKGAISIKVEEFIPYLKSKENKGWVNFDIKKSKAGKLYIDLNDWKPKETGFREAVTQGQQEAISSPRQQMEQGRQAAQSAPLAEGDANFIDVNSIPF